MHVATFNFTLESKGLDYSNDYVPINIYDGQWKIYTLSFFFSMAFIALILIGILVYLIKICCDNFQCPRIRFQRVSAVINYANGLVWNPIILYVPPRRADADNQSETSETEL